MKKKIIIGIVILILVVAVSVLTTLVVVKNMDKDEKSSKSSSSAKNAEYEEMAKEFAKALKSVDDMKAFADKYVDFEANYAIGENDMSLLSEKEKQEVYDNRAKYADEDDFIMQKNAVLNGYAGYVGYDLDLTFKKITKPTKGYYFNDDKEFTATYEDQDGKTVEFFFAVCDGKIYQLGTVGDLSETYGEKDFEYQDFYGEENSLTSDGLSEKDKEALEKFDTEIVSYLERTLTGAEVGELLDIIMDRNDYFVDYGEFLGVNPKGLSCFSAEETRNLLNAMANASLMYGEDYVKEAKTAIKALKSAIGSSGSYRAEVEEDESVPFSINIYEVK